VFCRNVLMYFTPAQAAVLVARITRSLLPGGHLFLGHAETLRGLSTDYELCHGHNAFFYRRKPAVGAHEPAPAPGAAPVLTDAVWPGAWLDSIQQASTKIRALAERTQAGAGRARRADDPRQELEGLLELVRRERFGEALARIERLPAEAAPRAELLLLRAVLLTHAGRLDAAEQACAEVLALDARNAGPHYLHALCREGAGDRVGAIEHDERACRLDTSFAMPRLHLGLMARRAGERAAARRELARAVTLLEREDPARLILFGGGFRREALISLCRAELDMLGGA